MINLLPTSNKKQLRAARSNVILLRYNIMTIAAVTMVFLSWGVFRIVMQVNQTQAETSNNSKQAEASKYSDTKKQADEYRQNLTTAKQILANQVNYTDVIFGITSLLPNGIVLDSINLTAKDFGGQTVLNAHASDYAAVTKLKSNFENSTLFSNVYLQSISSAGDGNSDKAHPISVNISVKINKVTK